MGIVEKQKCLNRVARKVNSLILIDAGNGGGHRSANRGGIGNKRRFESETESGSDIDEDMGEPQAMMLATPPTLLHSRELKGMILTSGGRDSMFGLPCMLRINS